MAQNVASNDHGQHAYMSYHEDGLLDLLVGLSVLLGGLYILVDLDIPLGGAWVVLWLPIWLSARKAITARRLPYVEIPQEQYAGMMRAATFVVITLTLAVFAGSIILLGHSTGSVPEWFVIGLRQYLTVVSGLLGALVLAIAGWLSKLNRLYAYALLTAVAFVGGYVLRAPTSLAVALVGGCITLWGLRMLAGFVRKHPIRSA
jgi:hypothetical protein